MGRGNANVRGDYEGLFYVDWDNFGAMILDDDGNETDEPNYEMQREEMEEALMREFPRLFMKRFPSFTRCDRWIRDGAYGYNERHAIMENRLFFVCLVDNEWSIAVELIQKNYVTGDYADYLPFMQSCHYRSYLEGMKCCLFELFPELGTYAGAWTSGKIERKKAG